MRVLGTTAAILCSAGLAQAGYIATFDQYSNGQTLNAVDGWQGWDGVSSVAGTVDSLMSYSGSNSLRIGSGYTDAVRTFAGANSGVWTFSARQFIAGGQSGSTYLILMNRYADGANNDSSMWSGELNFNLSTGQVGDELRGGSVAIAFNQWALLNITVDLTNNTVSQFYNGALIASGAWTTGAGSALSIAALDLYTGGGNTAFYDEISLTGPSQIPAPGASAALAMVVGVLATRRTRARAWTR